MSKAVWIINLNILTSLWGHIIFFKVPLLPHLLKLYIASNVYMLFFLFLGRPIPLSPPPLLFLLSVLKGWPIARLSIHIAHCFRIAINLNPRADRQNLLSLLHGSLKALGCNIDFFRPWNSIRFTVEAQKYSWLWCWRSLACSSHQTPHTFPTSYATDWESSQKMHLGHCFHIPKYMIEKISLAMCCMRKNWV